MRYRAAARGGGAPRALRSRSDARQSWHLDAYLSALGLTGEAELARRMASSTHARAKLFELLHRKKELPLPADLEQAEALVKLYFGSSRDLVFRRLTLGATETQALLVYLGTMVDEKLLERTVSACLRPAPGAGPAPTGDAAVRWLKLQRASVPDTVEYRLADKAITAVAEGRAVLFVAGATTAVGLGVVGGPRRSVSESKSERVVRGPREGFVESLTVNTTLIRRRIRDPRLRMDLLTVGDITRTNVAVLYIATVCKQSLVDEVLRRIRRVKIDGILDSGQLLELIEDTPWTFFPLVRGSERPDSVAGALLEGRVAIVVDGSPFVLIAPTSIIDMLHTPEDYYERFPSIFLVRALRFLFTFVALFGPSLYVALTTFHREMIPTNLLLSIMASREGVPFPAVLEALIMELGFEIIREAGLRMPTQMGQSVSIIGALILGESAVRAGIVSAPMIITVAVTGLAGLMLPSYSTSIALRVLRFPMLVLAGTFGAYGLTLGAAALLIHLFSLRSFGAPYMAPLAPLLPADMGDVVLRLPQWMPRKRSASIEQLDARRSGRGMKPGPGPHRNEGGST